MNEIAIKPPNLKLTTHKIALTHDVQEASIYIFHDLLSQSQCEDVIGAHLDLVPANVTAQTVRTRQVFEDEELATSVWEKIKDSFVEELESQEGDRAVGLVKDSDGEVWKVKGLNERWRLCLYEAGGKFSPHQDSRHQPSIDTQSFMTLNIYLTTVPETAAGATRFFHSSPYTTPSVLSETSFKSQPVLGTAAMFRDYVWHDGEEVKEGRKYLLRTDVMFERVEAFDEERVWGGLTEEERARRCVGMAEGLEDGGSSEEAIRWYKKAYRLWPELQNGS